MKVGPFGDLKEICEKKSHKAEVTFTKKFWSRARLEPTHILLFGTPQKILTNLYAQRTLVCQLKEASLQSLKYLSLRSS